MFETDVSRCNLAITEKKTAALFDLTPTRVVLSSPYPQYNAFSLNMRRKAEILQYPNNRTNTKTNNFTKNQKWSQLVHRYASGTRSPIGTIANCPNRMVNENITKPTWTTASNVPGPPMMLQMDPNIPLYNYNGVSQRSYSMLPNNRNSFNFFPFFTLVDPSSTILLGSIVFSRYTEPDAFFQTPILNIPIGVSLHGILPDQATLTFTLSRYVVRTVTDTIVYSTNESNFQVSLSQDMMQRVSGTTDISASIFLDTLTIPSFTISSGPNYVYNMYAYFHGISFNNTFTTQLFVVNT